MNQHSIQSFHLIKQPIVQTFYLINHHQSTLYSSRVCQPCLSTLPAVATQGGQWLLPWRRRRRRRRRRMTMIMKKRKKKKKEQKTKIRMTGKPAQRQLRRLLSQKQINPIERKRVAAAASAADTEVVRGQLKSSSSCRHPRSDR